MTKIEEKVFIDRGLSTTSSKEWDKSMERGVTINPFKDGKWHHVAISWKRVPDETEKIVPNTRREFPILTQAQVMAQYTFAKDDKTR